MAWRLPDDVLHLGVELAVIGVEHVLLDVNRLDVALDHLDEHVADIARPDFRPGVEAAGPGLAIGSVEHEELSKSQQRPAPIGARTVELPKVLTGPAAAAAITPRPKTLHPTHARPAK